LEIPERMVKLVWLVPQVPPVTKVLVDHQAFQENLALMVKQELPVSLDEVEKRDQRVCKDHREWLVSLDPSDWRDHQDRQEAPVNVETEETQDRKEFLDLKDKEELLEQLVWRERKEPADLKERRVIRDTTDYQVCLVSPDRRVCLVLKEWVVKTVLKDSAETQDLVVIQEMTARPEDSVPLESWDLVVCQETKDRKVMVDLQAQLDLQAHPAILADSMPLNCHKSLETKTKAHHRLMILMERSKETRSRATKC